MPQFPQGFIQKMESAKKSVRVALDDEYSTWIVKIRPPKEALEGLGLQELILKEIEINQPLEPRLLHEALSEAWSRVRVNVVIVELLDNCIIYYDDSHKLRIGSPYS